MRLETITTDISDGVAKITFNRPDKFNCFNEKMHRELKDAIYTVQIDAKIRCVLITGAGKAFSAGQDLGDTDNLDQVLNDYYNPLITAITTMNKPVICAVNGVAAGAGANIALASDIVIAGKSASFIQAFSKIGLIPDAGGTWILPRLIGHARASALTLLAEAVSAEQAEQWGMIYKAVADDDLQDMCESLARKLAGEATTSFAFTKRLLQLSWQHPLEKQMELEKEYQRAAANTADFKEGLSAFLNKRNAKFTGQ